MPIFASSFPQYEHFASFLAISPHSSWRVRAWCVIKLRCWILVFAQGALGISTFFFFAPYYFSFLFPYFGFYVVINVSFLRYPVLLFHDLCISYPPFWFYLQCYNSIPLYFCFWCSFCLFSGSICIFLVYVGATIYVCIVMFLMSWGPYLLIRMLQFHRCCVGK